MSTYFIDLQSHHIKYLRPVIEARMSVLKKRVLKKYGEDWYDYDEEGIESKVKEHNDEYLRLGQILNEVSNASN